MTTNEVLKQRGDRYGSFDSNAKLSQGLKVEMHTCGRWHMLRPYQKEALDMIQHKISRVLNGDHLYEDNWVDIIGYAQLALDQIRKERERKNTPPLFEQAYEGAENDNNRSPR